MCSTLCIDTRKGPLFPPLGLSHTSPDLTEPLVRNKRIKNPANDIAKIREAVASSGP